MAQAQRRVSEEDDRSSAFRVLYHAHYADVLAYCGRRVGRSEAADLATEVFSVAWQRMGVIPQGGESLRWLYAVAYRVVGRHWRSERRRSRLGKRLASVRSPDVEAPDTPLVQREEYSLVLEAACRLKTLDREVLRLAIWEELTHAEIADVVGSTETAVRQRLHRARRALRREFERIGGILPNPTDIEEGGV